MGLRQASGPEADQPFELYAPGLHHLAFHVSNRQEVDEVHERAVAAGAEVLHAPREWPYAPRYYATFFLDPDGFRVEVLVKW
jgi:catechol 2,3-dioxygenase-like lactoylglutathione lyase family enzyme